MRVLVAAQEAGSANALVPVIDQLAAREGVALEFCACDEAAVIFSRHRVPYRAVESFRDGRQEPVAMIARVLRECAPDVLLLGASWGPAIEKVLLALIEGGAIPSLAVFDNWSHYRERFTDPRSGATRFPTTIVVPDARAFAFAIADGVPKSALTVTGQPYLDALASELHQPGLYAHGQRLRGEWLATARRDGPGSRAVVLFASEAFSQFNAPTSAHYYGFTELDALDGLIDAVDSIERSGGPRIELVVKLHPKQRGLAASLDELAARRPMRIVSETSPWACLLASDAVVGMSSMLLLESALAGKPAISFRPGAQRVAPFVGCELGVVSSAGSVEELAGLLASELSQASAIGMSRRTAAVASLIRGDAAWRIAETVVSLGCAAMSVTAPLASG